MLDFIKTIYEGITSFVKENVVDPIRQLWQDIKDGYVVSGLADFFLDTGIGNIVAIGLTCCVGVLFTAAALLTETALGTALFIVSYLAFVGTLSLSIYGVLQFISKRLGMTKPFFFTLRKRAAKLEEELRAKAEQARKETAYSDQNFSGNVYDGEFEVMS